MRSHPIGETAPAPAARARPLLASERLALCYALAAAGAIGVFGLSLWSVGLPALLFLGLVADGILRPGSQLLYPTVTRGPRERPWVALSFDDGPHPEVTPAVLDALAAHGAQATFFAIGRSLAEQPGLARRIAAEGHELGNHSWEHSRWKHFFSTAAQHEQIERGAGAIAALGVATPPLYRPPMGLKPPTMARAAAARGLTVVAWSVHSKDTRDRDPQRIARRVLARIGPGDIVLLHDGHDLPGGQRPACARATSLILEGLAQKGLRCVTVSELLRPAATP